MRRLFLWVGVIVFPRIVVNSKYLSLACDLGFGERKFGGK
jgi:hypothetical protein